MTKIELSTTLSYGILNWYPFEQGASVYFMGDCTPGFAQDMTRRGLILKDDEPCDYVIAMNLLERAQNPKDALAQCKKHLKPEGHLFLVCENRLGLRYFIGDRDPFTHRSFDGVENYRSYTAQDRELFGGHCYAGYEIESFLEEMGLQKRRGYSILPGLEMPQQMYAWDYLPEENMEIRYTPLYHNPSSVFLDEKRLYDNIIQNGMFHQMANAYLIDCTLDGEFYEINHVTTSMDRGVENATATIIQKDGRVVKKALYPEGNQRIATLCDNTEDLKERGLSVVGQQKIESGVYGGKVLKGICMPYIKAPTAVEYLRELVHLNKDKFIEEMSRFLDCILQSSEEISDDTVEVSELGPVYKKAYIDMVPLNCFYVDGQYYFYDQEFCEPNYPVNVVLIRALEIVYMNNKSMEAVVPRSYFLQKYGLETKQIAYRDLGSKYILKLRHHDELSEYHMKHMVDLTVVNSNRQRMNYSSQEYNDIFINLLKNTQGKSVYIFGSGLWARKFVAEYGERVHIEAMLDNKESNWGRKVDGIEVTKPDCLKELHADDYKVIVCVKYYTSILAQLRSFGCKYIGIYDPYIEQAVDDKELLTETALQLPKEKTPKPVDKPYNVGYVAGVFDLFHIGHLNILKRAKEQCEYLIVGVVSDEQAGKGKAHSPYVCQEERREIVEACQYVDEAFILPIVASGTRDVYKKYHFDAQFSGSDYENDPNWLMEQAWLRERGAELVFFPYTESTSSTKLKKAIEG